MSLPPSCFLTNLRHAANSSTFTVDTHSPPYYVRDGLDISTALSGIEFTLQGVELEAGGLYSDADDLELREEGTEFAPIKAETNKFNALLAGIPARQLSIVTISP